MTILVGLIGRRGAVIAADSRRFSSTGEIETDSATKVFKQDSFVYGISGQLAPGGVELSDIIARALRTPGIDSIEAAANAASSAIVTQFTTVAEDQVSFKYRDVGLILIGTDHGIVRGILLRIAPDAEKQKLVESRAAPSGVGDFMASGDDSATRAVKDRFASSQESVAEWKLSEMSSYAEHLILCGIERAGPHPIFPDRISCGGRPKVLRLSKNAGG